MLTLFCLCNVDYCSEIPCKCCIGFCKFFSDQLDKQYFFVLQTPSTTGSIFNKAKTCIFCNCKQKKSGNKVISLIHPQNEEFSHRLQRMATILHDSKILLKLKSQSIAYHKPCYAGYQTKERRLFDEHVETSWHASRDLHKQAFECISNYIAEEIIVNNKVMYLAKLFLRYQAVILEFENDIIEPADLVNYRVETLEKKLLKNFGDTITIEASTGPRHQKIVYKTDIEVSIMANNTKFLERKNDEKFDEVSFHLRNCIKKNYHQPLPSRLTADDVMRGECEIPKLLYDFMMNLVRGPDTSNKKSHEIVIQVTSICSDIIYAVTRGRCKPAKKLTLGLAVKSLTNSRQVMTMLNRYGHAISYNLAEELETEMTYTSVKDNNIIPTGIIPTDGCSTHVAFDNFDRFVDTTSGKDTMHDTVGIIYQFPPTQAEDSNVEATTSSMSLIDDNNTEAQEPSRKRSKRRTFTGISRDVQAYYSKPTTSMELISTNSFINTIEAYNGATEIAIKKDILWVLSLLRNDSVSIWLGFNCMTSIDLSEIQNWNIYPQ